MVTVSRLLDRLYEEGVRPAEPGEFTKRAFLNGKMDLIQAEAVADIIHAHSELQQRVAQKQLEGGLSARIGTMADEMVAFLADIEANIDFIEEGIDSINIEGALALVDAQMASLDELLESAPLTRPFREGYSVVIAGPVNAGKSSLFNRLAGQQRAIVTDIPGTTRDLLREPVVLDGLLFVFQDTAGTRDGTGDRVEEIGLNLAAAAVRSADVVLFVIDGSGEVGSEAANAIAELDSGRMVVVVNKSDLRKWGGLDDVLGSLRDRRVVNVSAVSGDGFEELRSNLVDVVGGEALSRMARERFVLNARLVTLLREARERTVELRVGLADRQPLEILAAQVREVLVRFEEATGRRYQDDLLDAIFSRFCLGK
jgi:tRNA modification GTPase